MSRLFEDMFMEADFDSLYEKNIRSHEIFIKTARQILRDELRVADPAIIVEFARQLSKAWTETIKAGVVADLADSIRDMAVALNGGNELKRESDSDIGLDSDVD